MIVADSEFVFSEGDLGFVPSGFLAQILEVSGLSVPPHPTLEPTTSGIELMPASTEGGIPGWALAIIIPCTIAIILIPCWILLCVSATKKLKFSILGICLQILSIFCFI